MHQNGIRTISVEMWHELTREGADVPVRIQLQGYSMCPLIRCRRDYVTIRPIRREPMLDAQGITDHRRYQQVRQFLNFRAREKNIPISGTFELTPLCNLDCKMCYVHLDREQMKGAELLPTKTWKDMMKQAVDAGMMYATITGGECLTYPGFRELYLYLRSMGVETGILTNGVLLDGEMAQFLIAKSPSPDPGHPLRRQRRRL